MTGEQANLVIRNDVGTCLLAMRILDAEAGPDLDHLLAVAMAEYDPREVIRWLAYVSRTALDEVGESLTAEILAMVEGLAGEEATDVWF